MRFARSEIVEQFGTVGEPDRDYTASAGKRARFRGMLLMFILPIVLLVAVVGSLPIWRHSKQWGYYPISGVGLIILIVLFLFWTGRL